MSAWRRGAGRLPAAALVAIVVVTVPQLLQAESGFGDPVRGQTLFAAKSCVSCHAVRGAGGNIGPDLGRTPIKASFYEIASRMWNHSLAMDEKMREFRVPRPSFQDNELGDLIAFLYFLNYFDEPGDPRIGKILFSEKHCIQCHAVDGEGGSEGPGLNELPRGVSPLRIAQDLWNHGPAMMRSIRRKGLSVPVFKDGEIIDLFAYLRSHGERQTAREFQSAGDPGRGKQLFESKECLRCHDVFGSEPNIGPDLGRSEMRGSVTQLAGRMWNHWAGMAEAMEALEIPLPEFEGEELAELFAYLFISRYDGEPGDPERGRTYYQDQWCAACHGLDGEGAGIGPALRGVTSRETREQVVQRMWNHAPEMLEEMGNQKIEWPRITARELADLLAFLATAWSQPADGS
jgi:mono/diheme cytochrome c family protein